MSAAPVGVGEEEEEEGSPQENLGAVGSKKMEAEDTSGKRVVANTIEIEVIIVVFVFGCYR